MKSLIASITILGLVGMVVGVVAQGASTDTVTATVTPQTVSVTVDIESVDYGVLDMSETSAPSAVITATNSGNVTEKLEIKGSDSTNWTLSPSAVGANTFMHEFATDDDSYASYTALNNTTYDTLDTSVVESGTQLFKLQLKMPSSTTNTETQSTTITVLATEV